MRKIHCFTSISYSYLDRARVLAETLRRFHPDWTLWLLMSDDEPEGFHFDLASEKFDHIVNVKELGIDNVRQWAFGHDVVELCTAVKGPMMHRLINDDVDAVIYIDPDIALFAPLDHVLDMLTRHSVVLTPHVIQAEDRLDGILDNEICSLQHGVYNLGFVAVRSCSEGKKFAAWWRDRLLKFCIDDIPNGLFTDQRWCDLAPALFADVGVLRDPGYNAASWNLGTRPISLSSDGKIRAGQSVLRFFHFTKVNSVGEGMLANYSYGHTEVFELLRWYRERLAANTAPGVPKGWWVYGTYADGTPIPRSHRLAFRQRKDLQDHFDDPFLSGPTSYQAWCATEGLV